MFKLNKVLVLDGVSPVCENLLREGGIEVTVRTGKLDNQDLIQELKAHDAVIVRSATKITAEVLAGASNLKVVGRAGTGVDNVDVKTATAKGVLVMNTPGGNTLSAAEHTCALMCALSREIPLACASLKEGKWDRKKFMGNELYGKTLAIIGLGRIGQEVAHRMQAFGMTTIGFDPLVSAETAKGFGVEWLTLDQIWPRADYITVHVPLIPQTRGLVGTKEFSVCKATVRILNVARGGIIDEDALLVALNQGRCAGAALDVYEQEPPTNTTLIAHPKVIATPHLGANTHEAQTRVAFEIAQQFVQMSGGGEIVGAINGPMLNTGRDVPNGWDKLATALGKMAQCFGEGGLKVTFVIRGSNGDKIVSLFKQYATLGYLKGKLSNGNVNLISAVAVSKEIGLDVNGSNSCESSSSSAEVCVVTPIGVEVKLIGCVSDGIPLLKSINGASFKHGVVLCDSLAFLRPSTSADSLLTKIFSTQPPIDVIHLSTKNYSKSWIALSSQGFSEEALSKLDATCYCMTFSS